MITVFDKKEQYGFPSNIKTNCHFHGIVLSHGNIKAAISDCNRLMGIIIHEQNFLVIQTLPERIKKRNEKEGKPHYLVFKRDPALINSVEHWPTFSVKEKIFENVWKRKTKYKRSLNEPEIEENEQEINSLNKLKNKEEEKEMEEESFCDVDINKGINNNQLINSFDDHHNHKYPSSLFTDSFALNSKTSNNKNLQIISENNFLSPFSEINVKSTTNNYTLPLFAKLDSLFIFPQLDPITLEIALFLDSMLYEHFKREFTAEPEQHLTDFSLALINNVHVLYQQPSLSPNLNIVIVRFEMWKTQPKTLSTELHKNGQAQTLLDSFCRHQARINPGTDLTHPEHWDHAVLLTGYDIYHTTSSVAGVAPVGRMCDELFACSLVEGLHLGRSFVLAHEMGHNMGMVHDGVQNQCGRSCCLMSAVNGAGKTTWSSCSVREFNAFLLQLDESGRGNCLRDPAESISSHDHLLDGRLPGQRFTADQQCSYFWGRDFQVEIPNGRSFEDICRILWCGNSGSTISTAHPALEGSWCGDEKWCHAGHCGEWNSDMGAYPVIIDGNWSEWTSAEKQCPITQCQITGSIAIISQMRTCTAPAPNNGGKACTGSNVRGIVCGGIAKSTICEGFNRQEYGDRLCTAIAHDRLRADRQLSGISFLHATQPCKVWCHVRDSELIRNKGQFPNGSPCGPDQYCVGGVCLQLNCDGHALVQSTDDCSTDESLLQLASIGHTKSIERKRESVKWEQWTHWSSCSMTCRSSENMNGVQERIRKCRSPTQTECTGKGREVRSCNPSPPICEPQPSYSEWTGWTECSATECGQKGIRRRTRECKTGYCTDPLIDEENCKQIECAHWEEWGPWEECKIKCGEQGQRIRHRNCSNQDIKVNSSFGCIGENFENETCIGELTKGCPIKGGESSVDGHWGKWHPCSVSCGIGFQFRERICGDKPCPGGGKHARTCHAQDCSRVLDAPVWSEWSLWSACSHSCGQGLQQRYRRCLNGICPRKEPLTESKRCVLGPCPQWTNWSSWTFCSTCSVFETRRRQRKCVVQVAKTEEGGDFGERELGSEACKGAPIEIDTCERSCTREGGLINGTLDDDLKSEGRFSQTNSSLENRHWTDWGEWSDCSVSCGPNGRQSRTRNCKYNLVFLCDEAISREERDCEPMPPKCKEEDSLLEKGQILYPSWSEWSDWSACSCFSLTRYRRRFCLIHDPQLKGFCPGSIIEQSPCTLPNIDDPMQCAAVVGGWTSWSEWSQCSQDCSQKGHRVRNRMCANPLPSNRGAYCVGFSFDQTPCDPHRNKCQGTPIDGSWTKWSEWSQCSNPCINGQRSRARFCHPKPKNGGKPCSGSDFELRSCSEPSICGLSLNNTSLFNNTNINLPQWSTWTSWSNCSSANCGFALRRRNRHCLILEDKKSSFCEGAAHQSMECGNGRPCEIESLNGRWSEWSDWSSNCAWTGCIGFDQKNEDLSGEDKNDSIRQFFEGSGEAEWGEDKFGLFDEEILSENNITLTNALAQAQLARSLNIRTRTRTCFVPTTGGIPCFGITSQKSLCPIEAKPEKCLYSSISQLLAHIWNSEFYILQLILKL